MMDACNVIDLSRIEHPTERTRKMNPTPPPETPDDDMSPRKCAGDKRRTLEAVLYFHDGETEALGQVLTEARDVRRSHRFTFCLLENMAAGMRLKDNPETVAQIRAEIARLITEENTPEDE